MSISVTYIEGACVNNIELKEFTEECCLAFTSVSREEIDDDDDDNLSGISTTETANNITITVFNREGETQMFISNK